MKEVKITYKGKKYKNYYQIIAFVDGKKVAHARFVHFADENRVWIMELRISSGYRRMQIGSMLLKHIESRARAMNAVVVEGSFEPKGIAKETLEMFYNKNSFVVYNQRVSKTITGDKVGFENNRKSIYRYRNEFIHDMSEIEYES